MTEQQPTEDQTPPEQTEREDDSNDERASQRLIFGWINFGLTTLGAVFIWVYLATLIFRGNTWLHPIMKQHFAALFGVPIAAVTALAVVMVLRISSGQLVFKVWVFKVRGAAGEALFWVLCFLSIVLALYLLY
jgi:magnesium-transporting ATPase (P-type)